MKLTAWNGEWLDSYWGVVWGKYKPGQELFPDKAPSKPRAERRIDAIGRFIAMLDADILFLCEAPEGEDEMKAFASEVTPDYELVTRPKGEPYHIQGRQWLWFMIKKPLADRLAPELVSVPTWREFAAKESPSINADGTWQVAVPTLKTFGEDQDVPVTARMKHSFYREPQILAFTFGGARHEVIGAHLKSKYVKTGIPNRRRGESLDDFTKRSKKVRRFLAEAHRARIKLSSEATAVRAYIDHRFAQEADPSILVVGDLNDGPGKELMEREFLLHDLLSNLQGNVFFAQRFLNHALFDQPQALRWTTKFQDKLDPDRSENILLDHILFTQALSRSGTSALEAKAKSGWVEHLAFETAESLFGKGTLSDHRPISVELTPRGN